MIIIIYYIRYMSSIFRYKQRASLKIHKDKNATISIDLTNVKMSKDINKLEESISSYELEIDLSVINKPTSKQYLDLIFEDTTKLL